jgi:ATP-dependent protease Clp ATPase subunit|tara:strand:- start:770 stop:1048 length:279 start_codon:yes stop_codon:yes gene_type:complete
MIQIQNENNYDIVKERVDENTIVITCKKKERSCDICSSVKKRLDVQVVKYPIVDKYMGRVNITKNVCNDCYDDVMEILNNLKYKYQGRRELS